MDPDHGRTSADVCGLRVLQDLVAAPSQIAQVRGWLRPEHFASPEHGQLYAVLRDLHAIRQPVDQVTVAWEADRRGITADPGGLSGGTGVFAVASAREVYRLGTLAQRRTRRARHSGGCCRRRKHAAKLLKSAAARIRALEPELSQDRQLLLGMIADPSAEGYRDSARQPDREAEK